MLAKHQDIFTDTPGEAKVTPFRNSKPVSAYPRRLPEKWKQKIQEEVKTLLATGIIVPSRSPSASPIVPVPKKNGQVRMCVDYRVLNSVTELDVYLLPNMDSLLEEISQARFITTMDLVKGCYQFPVHEDDQQKTAFVTPNRKWQFTRMPFGLKGAPAAFQREMDSLFQDYANLSSYIDDVAVYSATWEQHLWDVNQALTLLDERGLTVIWRNASLAEKSWNSLVMSLVVDSSDLSMLSYCGFSQTSY